MADALVAARRGQVENSGCPIHSTDDYQPHYFHILERHFLSASSLFRPRRLASSERRGFFICFRAGLGLSPLQLFADSFYCERFRRCLVEKTRRDEFLQQLPRVPLVDSNSHWRKSITRSRGMATTSDQQWPGKIQSSAMKRSMGDEQDSTWTLRGQLAEFVAGEFCCTLDLANPAAGLRVTAPKLPRALELFKLNLPNIAVADIAGRLDAFVRGDDLVANYEETPQPRFRTQVYWRRRSHVTAQPSLAIELVISMQTELLDTQPALEVISSVVGELAVCDFSVSPRMEPVNATSGEIRKLHGEGKPAAFLTKCGGDWSYFEAAHPLDSEECVVRVASTCDQSRESRQAVFELRHRLLAHRLEKGVILRSRILGALFPPPGGLQPASKAYAEFANSALPLTA